MQQGGIYSLILLKAKNEEKLKEKLVYYCLDQKTAYAKLRKEN